MAKFFIAVYTHEVKSYCDAEFFSNIANLTSKDFELHVVDNSPSASFYLSKIKTLCESVGLETKSLSHLDIPEEPTISRFQRNVCDSVNFLRDKFLESDCDYFLIIESDVIPPVDVLERFLSADESIDIVAGIYYKGHHKDEWFNEEYSDYIYGFVFSGCTLYKRHLVEKIPFRIDENDLGNFPDTLISHDASDLGYKSALYTSIKCDHLHAIDGSRNYIK